MLYRAFLRFLSVVLLGATLSASLHAQGDAKNGKTLFISNCASCHALDMRGKSTGPALGEGIKNWLDDRPNLYRWVRNSQELVKEGHKRAVTIFNEFNKQIMNPMTHLKDQDIEDIVAFIEEKYNAVGTAAAGGGGQTTGSGGTAAKEDNSAVWWVLLVVLLFGVAMLGRYINNLQRLAAQKSGEEADEKSVLEILLGRGTMRVLTYLGILIGGYYLVNAAVGIGRQQGYAPEQPIKFSHALHAGTHQIDCQYCHDGARRSKHGVIPATNTCINCHKQIQWGPKHGTAEIMKIYAAAGFDPVSGNFFLESVSKEERAKTLTDWAVSKIKDEAKKSDAEAERMAQDQVNAAMQFAGKPIEWVRIHNLPDHVYFNHAQHVTVGKVACQTCHGKVEEAEVLGQYATLSMGWCINCHRQTNVQFAGAEGNKYYSTYERYHQELQSGERSSVKVADIGGLDCQKCHY